MKKLEEIIIQEPVFLNAWSNEDEVFKDFATTKGKEVKVLFASYGCDNYEGDAFVLLAENGVLYEASGAHCSCYGLEGQWEPEEVVLEEIEHRLIEGEFGTDSLSGNTFKDELCEFLGVKQKR